MTTSTIAVLCGLCGITAGSFVAEAATSDSGPWLVGAVVAMGTFVALIVKWMMSRQDALHAENRAIYEGREKKFTRLNGEQVLALRACVGELSRMNQRQVADTVARASAVSSITGQLNNLPCEVVRELLEQGFVKPK